MTDLTTTAPASPTDRRRAWEKALADAKQYLTATVGKVHPDLSAGSLLRYACEYRAHLAVLAAACDELTTDVTGQA